MKIVITGTTGFVGEGVLLECLQHPAISQVISVSRKPTGISHAKLEEYLVPDFLALSLDDPKLKGYDACFFCAGISSVGIKEAEYKRITYDTTLHFAKCLSPNPQLSFIYVSGSGTDSSEKGRLAWARIKGKTENDLMRLPFKQAFGYRVGFMKATNGQKRMNTLFKAVTFLYPVLKTLFPRMSNTIHQVALSMIYVSKHGYPNNIIHVKDIDALAAKDTPNA
ncbi:epimerase [Paraflavitalea pollutisoli]|uniref:epimerase n=1 Tax=Paraflavitalea pollutisoli TaxID=3034143 RepID=UPI0023EAC9F3|nr:epimerase [Paraflavitalea sp. H1-2-19X]